MRKGVMLAYPYEEKRLLTWHKPWLIQPKLDGDRMRAIFNNEGKVTLLSSEGHEKLFFPKIVSELESLHLKNVELDGEAYIHGLPHEEIHSIMGRSVNPSSESDEMQFHIFDFVDNLRPNIIQMVRLKLLDTYLHSEVKRLIKVPYQFITELDDVYKIFERFISEGYEGYIMRDSWAYYVRKRSTQMMKFKPKKEDTYLITGFIEEVDKYGVPKNALGALECASNDGSGSTFRVGTGFTEEERRLIWKGRFTINMKDAYAKVKYQNVGSRGGLRHSVFVEIVGKPNKNPNNYEVF
jgi:ATP-dependent DNA ligase